MGLKKDEIRWTVEGRAEVAEYVDRPRLTGTPAQLAATIAKSIAKQKVWWTAGLAKSDKTGVDAVTLAKAWTPKTKLDVVKAAKIGSLLGSYESDEVYPFVEWMIQVKGAAFALAAMGQAWRYHTHYHNPGWPKSEKGCQVWLKDEPDEIDDDSSVSYGKARMASYLALVGAADPGVREEMRKALPKLLATAVPQQMSPLIYAAHDVARANELLAKINRDKFRSRFGEDSLANVSDDPKLVFKSNATPTLDRLERFGAAALLPRYEAALKSADKYTRGKYLQQLANIHGPKAARLVGSYVTMASQREHVVAYFKRYPELLDVVLADPKAAEDHDYLEPLKAR